MWRGLRETWSPSRSPSTLKVSRSTETSSSSPFWRVSSSWASGPNVITTWGPQAWQASLPVRGVIGYHPLPRIRKYALNGSDLTLQWEGPASTLYDSTIAGSRPVHGYVVEMASSLGTADFAPVSSVLLTNTVTISNCPSPAYLRLKLVKP